MSGRWMKAAREFTGYEGVTRGQLHETTAQACRAVLQRLTERADDCGVVAIYQADLERSVGLSQRAVRRALHQLERDGWIWHAVRGQGSRARDFRGTPAPTVYALRPLPVAHPRAELDLDQLRASWTKYAFTPRFRNLIPEHRQAIREAIEDAWTPGLLPVDNHPPRPRPTGQEGTTNRPPVAALIITGRTTSRRGHLRPVDDLPAEPELEELLAAHSCIRPEWKYA